MKCDVAKGSPQGPYSEIELSHKFIQCSLGTLYKKYADVILNKLWTLDALENVNELFRFTAVVS